MHRPDLSDLRLLHLVSPNLPTGAFTYSQGMEWAVECGWLTNFSDTKSWLQSLLNDNQRFLELPLLARLYTAARENDKKAFYYWSQLLYASRETAEFRSEEKHRARALYNVLNKLPDAKRWSEMQGWQPALLISQIACYGLAANHWQISLLNLLYAFVWGWLDNAVTAAIKLVPLGQSEAQKLLYELCSEIGVVIEFSMQLDDDEIGSSSPALAIASCLHETQYSRLFRS